MEEFYQDETSGGKTYDVRRKQWVREKKEGGGLRSESGQKHVHVLAQRKTHPGKGTGTWFDGKDEDQ